MGCAVMHVMLLAAVPPGCVARLQHQAWPPPQPTTTRCWAEDLALGCLLLRHWPAWHRTTGGRPSQLCSAAAAPAGWLHRCGPPAGSAALAASPSDASRAPPPPTLHQPAARATSPDCLLCLMVLDCAAALPQGGGAVAAAGQVQARAPGPAPAAAQRRGSRMCLLPRLLRAPSSAAVYWLCMAAVARALALAALHCLMLTD
jgi:hypothetical protein